MYFYKLENTYLETKVFENKNYKKSTGLCNFTCIYNSEKYNCVDFVLRRYFVPLKAGTLSFY